MKKLFIILAAVAMVFVACKKENPTNNSSNNNQWGAETLSDFYICPVEVTNKLWTITSSPAAVCPMLFKLGKTNS